ncbi:hypothetical protein E2C01_013280 [Portunus trituberculatus]|uniref:Uncharacterized protein n=1 Tax=Portunus trituberculatus TaxID=210409 RepID=A0A5B7DGN3_PORTR|nr:hypothetical protein [Portunus trituberculatus]
MEHQWVGRPPHANPTLYLHIVRPTPPPPLVCLLTSASAGEQSTCLCVPLYEYIPYCVPNGNWGGVAGRWAVACFQLSKEDELDSLAPLLLLSDELLAVFFIRLSASGRLPSLDCSISSIRSDLLLECPLSPDTDVRLTLSSRDRVEFWLVDGFSSSSSSSSL